MPIEHFHKFGQELVKDNVGINHHVRQNILSRNFFRIVIVVPISENLDAIEVIVQLKGPMSQTVVCAKQEFRNICEFVGRNLQIKECWNFTQNGTALLTTWDMHFLIKWDSYLRRQPYSQSTRARCPS